MADNLSPLPPGFRHRSFAGPVVLIVIGVVFLLGTLHRIPWLRLEVVFARWWPLLIILWGVIRLVEYILARNENRRPAGFGAGGVLLLIILIIAGLTATGIHRVSQVVNFDDLGDDHDFFSDMFGQTYHFSQELQQAFPAGSSLKVVSEPGAITVNSWDQSEIKVVVSKKLRAEDQAEADKADAATRATLTVNGSEVLLNANTAGAGSRGVRSDLTVYVPRQAAVNAVTRRGDVTITGRTGDVQVSDSHGDVALNDVTGGAHLAMNHGSVHVSHLTGDLVVQGRMEDVNLSDVTGSAAVNGDVMDALILAHISKQVSYHSSRTDLELASLAGNMRLESGDLQGKGIAGPVRLTTRSKDIHLEEVSGEVRIENSNGALELESKLPLGELRLSNRNADIRLVLPLKAAFEIDAATKHGDIHSDFMGISVSGSHGESRASGVVGSGGPRLVINNEHGDVEIVKAG
jgi:DUF4097 and DUF4098 domain-containing protein YvlB